MKACNAAGAQRIRLRRIDDNDSSTLRGEFMADDLIHSGWLPVEARRRPRPQDRRSVPCRRSPTPGPPRRSAPPRRGPSRAPPPLDERSGIAQRALQQDACQRRYRPDCPVAGVAHGAVGAAYRHGRLPAALLRVRRTPPATPNPGNECDGCARGHANRAQPPTRLQRRGSPSGDHRPGSATAGCPRRRPPHSDPSSGHIEPSIDPIPESRTPDVDNSGPDSHVQIRRTPASRCPVASRGNDRRERRITDRPGGVPPDCLSDG